MNLRHQLGISPSRSVCLCIAALAKVSDGAQTNIVAVYRQLFEFARVAKGLDFFRQ